MVHQSENANKLPTDGSPSVSEAKKHIISVEDESGDELDELDGQSSLNPWSKSYLIKI